jgi:hypothetical protein
MTIEEELFYKEQLLLEINHGFTLADERDQARKMAGELWRRAQNAEAMLDFSRKMAKERTMFLDETLCKQWEAETDRDNARKMVGEQWQRALNAEFKIDGLKTYTIDLCEEIAELQMECDRESDFAFDAEKGGQYYLTVLKKVADWFGERDLPCPICGEKICTPECELKSVLGDLL